MNALIWNARGMGKPSAFHELRRMIADNSPDVLFICETKLKGGKKDVWRIKLGFDGWFRVDAEGASGGLILAWTKGNQSGY